MFRPRKKVKLTNDRIDHVQAGLKADALRSVRPLKEFAELAHLIGEQFDCDTSTITSEVIPCQIM
tara:strand:+ start:564 stop:758 length:195 start_codon:yes stop_codon:yes gene_type:complete